MTFLAFASPVPVVGPDALAVRAANSDVVAVSGFQLPGVMVPD